jgi:polysaccharide export outer membrane protein
MGNVECRHIKLRILGSLVAILLSGLTHAQTVPADYRLHAGDKLDVSVWKETEMQKPNIVIAPDGKFSFPLAGQVAAAGKTVAEVRQEIENRLKAFIPEAVVTVAVLEVGGDVAYVIGQVSKPGAFLLNPRLNVLQALSLAGGGTPFAKLDSIIVLRGSHASQRALPFRFSQVSSGRNLEQNVDLESGDVIVVP